MVSFGNASIRSKITVLTMCMGIVLLVITTGAFVITEVGTFRQRLVQELTIVADVVGANSTGAIAFGDQKLAEQTLGALRVVPHLITAEIYTPDGRLFARYSAQAPSNDKPTLPSLASTPMPRREHLTIGVSFAGERLELIRPISLDGSTIGMTVLQAGLGELTARLQWYTFIVACLMVSGSVLAFLLSGVLQRLIAKPIIRLAEATSVISREKDYTIRVEKQGSDELGRLVDGFNDMLGQIQTREGQLSEHRQQLEAQLAAVQEGAQTLTTSIESLSRFLSDLTRSSSEVATAVSETATTVEEVKQTAYVAHSKAQAIANDNQKTAVVSTAGEAAVEEAVEGMSRVREKLEAIAYSVTNLGEQNQTVGDIIVVVNTLAEQSNLLAINAAIEAAKAGEAGKGFTVVAQEVRNLAEQSKHATARIRTILNDTQKAITQAVTVTEQGTQVAELGVQQSLRAGEAIKTLSTSIRDSVQAMSQIAGSSQQQLVGMDQVVSAMESIRQVTRHNVDGVRQLEDIARNLQHVGQQLTSLMRQPGREGE